MKYFIVCCCLIFSADALSQTPAQSFKNLKREADTATFPTPLSFKFIDSTCGLSKTVIYRKAKEWIATSYGNLGLSFLIQDSLQGKILAKVDYSDLVYNINIDIKEGKYRCVYEEYKYKGTYGPIPMEGMDKLPNRTILRTQMLLMMRSQDKVFKLLDDYVRKPDDNF